MGGYGDYVLVFAIAATVTFLVTFPARRLATRFGVLAQPGEDHVHTTAMPTVGGGAMLLGLGAAMALAWRLPGLHGIFADSYEPIGVLAAGAVIYLVGLVDDLRDISAPAKVAGMVIAAMVLVFLGVTMWYFKIPFEPTIIDLSSSLLPLVTALWVIGMANAVNLIDGLDGLAAGIVAIASGALCVYGLHLVELGYLAAGTNELGPLVAAITCGLCVGFLPHNFHPARAFMGDGGSMLLGLLMAAATMLVGGRTSSTAGVDVSGLTFFPFAPLFIPFFILGVPILDTAFAIVRRAVRRTGVATRDLGHLHHRLMRLGHGQRRAVLILWAWTAVLSAFVLYPTFVRRANGYVPFGVAFLVVALYTVFRPGRRGRAAAGSGLLVATSSGVASGATQGGQAHPPGSGEHGLPGAARPAGTGGGGEHGAGRGGAPAPLPVVMSGAAGVAVAGAPELPAPRGRRRRVRGRVPRLAPRRQRIGRTDSELPG
jgi:UDP-GlcNAc:undecaprenyl-phosphate GlcNAc-1-phosphate transferase